MRLVAVSVVKNEADIIEPFVRHTLAWCDRLLVLDHDSTDGTREILAALQAEGLPVSLYADEALGNLQQWRSNHLSRLAAREFAADWILPLDADEIFCGPGRAELEQVLAAAGTDLPASIPLLNYFPTAEDDDSIVNPVQRLRHGETAPGRTRKILVPRPLALEEGVQAGKGSHALYRGPTALADRPLADAFHLAHLALRSPPHQALRVVLAELQKLARGQAHAGLDVHYRLGFQLLAEDPGLFFATVAKPVHELRLLPIAYRGAALRYGRDATGWSRVARALLPFLEKLAASHGRLLDAAGPAEAEATNPVIRELGPADLPRPLADSPPEKFSGFTAVDGWGGQEGPVADAFLPVFHWGYAPVTRLTVHANEAGPSRLIADALTYSEGQVVQVELNGAPIHRHAFTRVNQKERLTAHFTLSAGENEILLRYEKHLITNHDPRHLAVIFLSLRVQA